METVTQRFLRYVSFDTTSDDESQTRPSSMKQMLLGKALVDEMIGIGISDAYLDEFGYVYGTVAGASELPHIGLIAHMDTSPDASGANIRAKLVHFDGEDIQLNQKENIYLRQADYPTLKNHVGKNLIVTDGTTLLGADDKAGIAEILTAAQTLIESGERHATLKIAFTPDEEIGRGADLFDIHGFDADFAYTVDGGTVGEIEYENFNAASASVTIHGLNIHPGSAKNKMKNSMTIAMEFHNMLPAHMRPEYTEGYEGFIHLNQMSGSVEESKLRYILRDHNAKRLEYQKELIRAAIVYINQKYGAATAEVDIQDSYRNMRECIEPHMEIVERAKNAMKAAGMDTREVAIRGGTDGARLSYEGLLCPNLCTGGENYHGRFEYIPVEDMEKCVSMLLHILTDF